MQTSLPFYDDVLYAMFVDSDTHKPTLAYFEVLEMGDYSQTAVEMMAGQTYKLTKLWDKLIYLLADDASVNNGKNSGKIIQFKEDHKWVLFVWCLIH